MLLPEQIVPPVVVVVTFGVAFTVMTRVAVPVQPADVPVTVYVVVVAGETVCVAPLRLPGIQLYVVAPEAVSEVLLPEQIVVLVAVVVTVGVGLTVMVRVAVFVQPFAFVPVTVYVVVVVGETVCVAPDKLPGIQLYVVAPLAVIEVLLPEQIVPPVVVVVTVGSAFTVITCVVVPVPAAFVAVCVTVYVPGVFHTTPVTFCVVAEAGVPLGNVHVQLVGPPLEVEVKLTGVPAQTVAALAVNVAEGSAAAVPVMLMLSM